MFDDLEEEGTRLIRAAGGFGRVQGIYTDRQLARSQRLHEVSIEDVYAQGREVPSLSAESKRAILDTIWPDLCDALPWREIYVLENMREGVGQAEMADGACVTERTIRCWKVAALKHLRASANPYWPPWMIEVLIEVFSESYLRRVGRL
jgi:DNA-binding NarL/FixJ family response regulator